MCIYSIWPTSPISRTSQPFNQQKDPGQALQHLSPRNQAEEQMPFCHDPWDKDPPIALASCPYYRRLWPPAGVHWGNGPQPTRVSVSPKRVVRLEAFHLVHLFCGFVMTSSSCLDLKKVFNSSMNVQESQQKFPTKQKTIPVIWATHMSGCSPHQLNARSL